jgi:type I restriction enzyme, S subunit
MEVRKGYKQTEVGVIPEGWDVKPVGEIADVKTGPFGSALHEKDYVKVGTPIITVEHLGDYGVLHSNLPLVSDFDKKRLKAYLLQKGDVVFSRVGSVDRNALIKVEEDGWLFSGRLLRVRPFREISSTYLSYHFHSEAFKQRVRDVAVGQTMASINTKILMGVKAIIPPTLAEQEAIAEALSDADALIESLETLLAKKRQVKQGAMSELLSGKRRVVESGEWEVKTIGEIGHKFLNGGTPSTKNEEYWNGHIPWITGADFIDQKVADIRRFITTEAVNNSATNVIEKGNLLIVTRTGVGKIAIAPFDLAISQDITGVYLKKEYMLPEFLYWYFSYNTGSLRNLNQGTSIAGITRDTLTSLSVPVPSIAEQTAIAEILSDMDAEIRAVEEKLSKARAVKAGMMSALLRGRIRLV